MKPAAGAGQERPRGPGTRCFPAVVGFSIFGGVGAKEGKVPESVNSPDICTLDHNRLAFPLFPLQGSGSRWGWPAAARSSF